MKVKNAAVAQQQSSPCQQELKKVGYIRYGVNDVGSPLCSPVAADDVGAEVGELSASHELVVGVDVAHVLQEACRR